MKKFKSFGDFVAENSASRVEESASKKAVADIWQAYQKAAVGLQVAYSNHAAEMEELQQSDPGVHAALLKMYQDVHPKIEAAADEVMKISKKVK